MLIVLRQLLPVTYQELVETLKRSGFTLKKWASNCPEVLEIIPVEDRLEANEFTLNAESSAILGLEWIIGKDCLQVCRGPNINVRKTLLNE